MYADTENDLGSADLMLYMAMNDPNTVSGGGIAYLALVCNNDPEDKKKKQSINNYGWSHSWQGELLAHELGHNLGKLTLMNGFESTQGSCDFWFWKISLVKKITLRGHSKTTKTRFLKFLTTYLPRRGHFLP